MESKSEDQEGKYGCGAVSPLQSVHEEELVARVTLESMESEEVSAERKRKPTPKYEAYLQDINIKDLKSMKEKVIKQVRKTLLLRGESDQSKILKQELSKSQVLWAEFNDKF